MNENTNIVDAVTSVDVETKRATRKPARDASSVRDMKSLVRFARTVTTANFADAIATVNANHGVTHAGRNVGRFSGHRIMATQNESLRDNATHELNDLQILFVWRADFPMGVGRVFTADATTGIGIVRGVRADYNRTGHGDPNGKPAVPSVQYGPARFTFAAPTSATKTA